MSDLKSNYYSLEFDFTFTEETGDTVFFASSIPYGYSDVLDLTAALQTQPEVQQVSELTQTN